MNREYNPQKTTKAIKAAAKMPALSHCTEEPFDIKQSEVVRWLADQPEILQAMFGYYHDKGAIVFDPETKKWSGVFVA